MADDAVVDRSAPDGRVDPGWLCGPQRLEVRRTIFDGQERCISSEPPIEFVLVVRGERYVPSVVKGAHGGVISKEAVNPTQYDEVLLHAERT